MEKPGNSLRARQITTLMTSNCILPARKCRIILNSPGKSDKGAEMRIFFARFPTGKFICLSFFWPRTNSASINNFSRVFTGKFHWKSRGNYSFFLLNLFYKIHHIFPKKKINWRIFHKKYSLIILISNLNTSYWKSDASVAVKN